MNIIEVDYKWNGSLSYRERTDMIILHHAEASSCDVEDIHRWHIGNGWTGIGYHYFVKKDGRIFRGRPEKACGAQAKGYNHCSIGICAEGSYMKEKMPEAQKQAIIDLIADIKKRYPNIPVKRHKDVNNTDCPGANYPFNEIVNGKPTVAKATPTVVAKEVETVNIQLYILRKGSEGPQVKTLQRLLRMLGYKDQYGNTLVIDGDFGGKTDHALKEFQKDNKLTVDGICGANSWNKLLK